MNHLPPYFPPLAGGQRGVRLKELFDENNTYRFSSVETHRLGAD